MNPLVSCCLITYNHIDYIEKAVESILMQQTEFEFEIIIADDFSKDGTREKIMEYAEKHPGKIKTIIREKNIGPAKNFIELLNAATGKYIAYLEGDDYWTDNLKLQQQADFLEAHDDYAISAHNTTVIDKSNRTYLYSNIAASNSLHHTFTLVDYLQNHFIHSSSLMFRRSMFKPFPWWYETAFAGDGFLILLLSLEGKIDYINKPMSLYRHNSNSVSNYSSRVEINKNFERHFKLFDEHSGYKFSKEINEKIFSLSFNLNYYNSNYFKKVQFFFRNLYKIITANKKLLPTWGRYKFLLPAQILNSRIDINKKKTK
jgi:glycosyltransferase involved in cell wall biosynthesis